MKYILTILIFLVLTLNLYALNDKAIYGGDDRYELNNFPNPMIRELGKSVATMIHKDKLILSTDGLFYDYPQKTLKETLNLCDGEAYEYQYSVATCSGFLISENMILTAGHCIENNNDCKNYKWVFDFNQGIEAIAKDNVYSCTQIIKRESKETNWSLKDYALIKIDREAMNRSPLKFRTKDENGLSKKDPLVVIGNPVGLPTKAAGNAHKQKYNTEEKNDFFRSLFKRYYYFRANLDTFMGNSGSPVINEKTGKVEGILVSGAPDYITSYEYDEPCKRSLYYSDSDRDAEEVVFIFGRLNYFKNKF